MNLHKSEEFRLLNTRISISDCSCGCKNTDYLQCDCFCECMLAGPDEQITSLCQEYLDNQTENKKTPSELCKMDSKFDQFGFKNVDWTLELQTQTSTYEFNKNQIITFTPTG